MWWLGVCLFYINLRSLWGFHGSMEWTYSLCNWGGTSPDPQSTHCEEGDSLGFNSDRWKCNTQTYKSCSHIRENSIQYHHNKLQNNEGSPWIYFFRILGESSLIIKGLEFWDVKPSTQVILSLYYYSILSVLNEFKNK